jgi:PA14 domain
MSFSKSVLLSRLKGLSACNIPARRIRLLCLVVLFAGALFSLPVHLKHSIANAQISHMRQIRASGINPADARAITTASNIRLEAQTDCIASVLPGQWLGVYFNSADLSGVPVMLRNDGAGFLDMRFGEGSPSESCGVVADGFSVRWTRNVNFLAGTYRFSVTGDDGVRLYINGQLIIDKWINQSPTTYTADVLLSNGIYGIRLEYFESGGPGTAVLSWAPVGSCVLNPPADIVVEADPALCGAIVEYPPPTIIGNCGAVTSSPPSGSIFPLGTTTVTITGTMPGGIPTSATFNVTVNEAPSTTTVFDVTGRPGDSAILIATVANASCTGGSVEFKVNGAVVGSSAVIGDLASMFYTITLAPGSYPIVATYSSSSPGAGSSGSGTLIVAP